MSALAEEREKHGELPTCLARCTVAKGDLKRKTHARRHHRGHSRLGVRVPQTLFEGLRNLLSPERVLYR